MPKRVALPLPRLPVRARASALLLRASPAPRPPPTAAPSLFISAGWFGLGPVVFTLIALHIAALVAWIALLARPAKEQPAKELKKE